MSHQYQNIHRAPKLFETGKILKSYIYIYILKHVKNTDPLIIYLPEFQKGVINNLTTNLLDLLHITKMRQFRYFGCIFKHA